MAAGKRTTESPVLLTVADRVERAMALLAAARTRSAPSAGVTAAHDLFARGVLPDVARGELTVERLASGVQHHGAIVVRNLLSEASVARLRRFADQGPLRVGRLADATSEQARMLDALVDSHAVSGLLQLAARYLGEQPVGMLPRSTVKRDERGPGLRWHQDGSFYGSQCGALNAWVALTPCGRECPSVSLIPVGLDFLVDPSQKVSGCTDVADTMADVLSRDHGIATPELEPGDAILFDEMTLHRTSAKAWTVPYRDVAITWFFAPSRYPAGWWAPHAF